MSKLWIAGFWVLVGGLTDGNYETVVGVAGVEGRSTERLRIKSRRPE